MKGIDMAGTVQAEKLPNQSKTFAKTEKDTDFTKLLSEKKQDISDGSGKTNKGRTDSIAGTQDSKKETVEAQPEDKKEVLESELLVSGLMAQLQAVIMQQNNGVAEDAAEPEYLIEDVQMPEDIRITDETTTAPDRTAGKMELPTGIAGEPEAEGQTLQSLSAETTDEKENNRVETSGLEKQPQTAEETEPDGSRNQERAISLEQETVSQEESAAPLHTETEPGARNEDKSDTGKENGSWETFAQASNVQQNSNLSSQSFERPMESALTMKTTPESLPQDLGRLLTADLTANGKTVTIELEPETLGKLTIKAEYDGGRLVVSILSSNPKTLEVLSQRAGELAGIMEAKTGQETIIQTPQAEAQEQQSFERQGGKNGDNDRQQEREKEPRQPDTFAQQLRLGLI